MAKHACRPCAAAVLCAALIVGCKSTPEAPEEVVEPAAIEKPAEPPAEPPAEQAEAKAEKKPEEKPAVSAVSDEEVQQARSAIARAREADAEYYEADLLRRSEEALEAALRARASDPAGARGLLAEAKALAGQALDRAAARSAADLDARLARMREALLEQKADRFLPEEHERAVAGIPEVHRLYEQGELADAREKAYSTLGQMSGLLERLQERKDWVETLRRDIDRNLKSAGELGAPLRAAEAFARANRLYLQGLDEYQGYRLRDSEETLAQAREASQEAIRLAGGRRQGEKEQSRVLMLEVMRLLEEASALTVVPDDGTVIAPAPWSGEPYLPEDAGPNPDTGVPADAAEENLLEQAKQRWQQGVPDWKGGYYARAEESFREARRLAEAYKALAADSQYPVYVVRLNPGRPDCLWRIAGYDFIYGNPYLWPRIWRRNRKLIQDPDRIYPGWKLVIPPR